MNFLFEDMNFKNCIKNICIYCRNIEKWGSLKLKYSLVYDVVTSKKGIFDFIKHFSSEETKPYHVTKLITYNDYLDKYKDRHIKISEFYGDLTPKSYKENIEKIKFLTNQENKDQKHLLKGYITFDTRKDLYILDELIREYLTSKIYYGDLNKCFMNSNLNSYELVAYLTSRIMNIQKTYAKNEGAYYSLNKEVRRGMKLPYSSLLPYERAKGKIILLSSFTLTTEEAKFAELFSGRNNTKSLYNLKKRFSIILIIKNFYKKNWIPNGVTLQKLTEFDEKEIIFQPFSFYFVKDVKIDYKNYKANIYLETIGKEEILEEKIQKGKEIEYNEKENIMQVKL